MSNAVPKSMTIIEKISSFTCKRFTVWVILVSIMAYVFPSHFTWIGGYVVPLLGVVMFGMGRDGADVIGR
ncbi:hypothetical protein JCM12214_18140 [Geobacillus vulcani]